MAFDEWPMYWGSKNILMADFSFFFIYSFSTYNLNGPSDDISSEYLPSLELIFVMGIIMAFATVFYVMTSGNIT